MGRTAGPLVGNMTGTLRQLTEHLSSVIALFSLGDRDLSEWQVLEEALRKVGDWDVPDTQKITELRGALFSLSSDETMDIEALFSPHTSDLMLVVAGAVDPHSDIERILSYGERVLRVSTYDNGVNHRYTFMAMMNLAFAYKEDGRYDKALPLYEEAVSRMKALGVDDRRLFTIRTTAVYLCRMTNAYDKALQHAKDIYRGHKREIGLEDPELSISLTLMADQYFDLGRHQEALPLYQQAYALLKASHGAYHCRAAAALHKMGALYTASGRVTDAIKCYKKVISVRKKLLGRGHELTIETIECLASVLVMNNRIGAGTSLFEEIVGLARLQSTQSGALKRSLLALGGIYHGSGQLEKALCIYDELVKLQQHFEPLLPHTLLALRGQARVCEAVGDLENAALFHAQSIAGMKTDTYAYAIDDNVLFAMAKFATICMRQHRYEEALVLMLKMLPETEQRCGRVSEQYVARLISVGIALEAIGNFDAAIPVMVEVLGSKKRLSCSDWDITEAFVDLARVYYKAGSYEDFLKTYTSAMAFFKPKSVSLTTAKWKFAHLHIRMGSYNRALHLFSCWEWPRDPEFCRGLVPQFIRRDAGVALMNSGFLREALWCLKPLISKTTVDMTVFLEFIDLTRRIGEFSQAEQLVLRAMEYSGALEKSEEFIGKCQSTRARIYCDAGRERDAVWCHEEALVYFKKVHRMDLVSTSLAAIAAIHVDWGRYAVGERLLREAIVAARSMGKYHYSHVDATHALADLLETLNRHGEALPLREHVVHARTTILGSLNKKTIDAVEALSALSEKQGDRDVPPMQRALLAMRNALVQAVQTTSER